LQTGHNRKVIAKASIDDVAGWLREARYVLALTGAGISTESGIPDFRGPGGVWTKDPKAERLSNIHHYMSNPEVRVESWRQRLDHPAWGAAPNSGHLALVELERKGHLQALVTQNIDGLHRAAGSAPAITVEIHGTMREVVCMSCGERAPMEGALARGARIYAELAGFGVSADAYHMVAPEPEGNGAARAMQAALDDAGIRPEDVDYINAHGTSTQMNDATETKAIKRVFGEHAHRLAISSTKSMLGHLLGASGGVEAVATAMTLREGFIHPTINLETPDPECDLDYVPGAGRRADVRFALSNSFGFGGQNACLVFKKYAPAWGRHT